MIDMLFIFTIILFVELIVQHNVTSVISMTMLTIQELLQVVIIIELLTLPLNPPGVNLLFVILKQIIYSHEELCPMACSNMNVHLVVLCPLFIESSSVVLSIKAC